MKSSVYVLAFLIFTFFGRNTLLAQALASTKDGNTVVIYYDDGKSDKRLSVINLSIDRKYSIPLKSRIHESVQLINDTEAMVYSSGGETNFYNIATGANSEIKEFCVFDKGKQVIYGLNKDYSEGSYFLKKYSLETKEFTGEKIPLQIDKKFITAFKSMMTISEDGSTIAIGLQDKDAKIFILKTEDGKLISTISGYKSISPFYSFGEKNEVSYLNLNHDGTQLLCGNRIVVSIYQVEKNKKLAEWKENRSISRINFQNAFFSADGQFVYIPSIYKLYTLESSGLNAISNIVVGGTMTTYSGQTKKEIYIDNNFLWSGMTVMKTSNKNYYFSLIIPDKYKYPDLTPMIWRRNEDSNEKPLILPFLSKP